MKLSLLFIALAACYGTDYQVHPDQGIAQVVLEATAAAAADWEANVPVKISVASTPCPDARTAGLICMHPIDAIPDIPWEPGIMAGYTVFTEMWLAEPLLEKMPQEQIQRLVAHEMGHAMGLLHTGPGSLMYPYAEGGALKVTPVDVAQWMTLRQAEGVLP